ncbi:carbohydrate ABC transporter permease [Lachnospiraceae bacterium OttesenSCG-928-D06]|nr:carbohydrate ABC transporter permease [Lachnospiraceae bacterium OttesenSCG-928-D06]
MKREKISTVKKKDIIYQIVCLVIGILLLLPVIYAINISFMPQSEILTTKLQFFPRTIGYIENFIIVFTQTKVFRFMLNSLIMAGVSSIVRIIVSSLAAFSFAFFEYRFKNILFLLVVGSMIIPADVLVIQNYFTTAQLGLINTYMGMMVVFFISGMNIFVMRQNFLSYSKSIREAALVDGCSNFKF